MKARNFNVVLLLFGLIAIPATLSGQQKLDLTTCRQWARENYPKLEQAELLKKISALKIKNNRSGYLPQVDLKGQATYQSDVVSFDIPIPGIDLEFPTNDQYKVYLDVKQTIWDGGMMHSKNETENAALEAGIQKVEVEAYQLNVLVEAYFFNLLLLEQNLKVLETQQEVLKKQHERLLSTLEFGVARQKDCDKLRAEIIQTDQKILEIESKKTGLLEILSVITGKQIEKDAQLKIPLVTFREENLINRPEFKYFKLQQQQLLAGVRLLTSSRNPVFFAFGQAGYGKPGMNMLSNEFDTFYIVGVGLSWRITDWKLAQRKKQINAYQREIIETVQSDFEQKQQMQLVETKEKISNIKELIKNDEMLIDLRKSITKRASSELENGTITSTDYLTDLSAETLALISYETHKIQLVQAIENYNTIIGEK
ncbi:MAG: TolC family protein [Prolixibacteraceae bacterium]|nr:TolC family protein [Prolixibacteraceae bacterium]